MLTCDDCGKTSEEVSLVTDPYSAEINNEFIEMQLCDDCYQDRIDDIKYEKE